ncbi:helix-turn-helix transcriptional regulator [Endozoicomonas sp. GU-1]|uniref:helix-turn-helix domain-containing protein n=1 Tax=Endozoicomonas sp. GU-1 TaxID=3009078 RepID=UPI0022B5075B|nr:helix-turn-helix transcriptional regulator [Endozoicomonas sp. GU-1]WBA79582.1 helix-turn-helix transcriptional regulator [Endozoicomonas sp. GU-1]
MAKDKIAALRLKEFMRERGIKNYELAEKLGVTNTTVSRWRIGDRGIPAGSVLKIASLYGLDWRAWWPEIAG